VGAVFGLPSPGTLASIAARSMDAGLAAVSALVPPRAVAMRPVATFAQVSRAHGAWGFAEQGTRAEPVVLATFGNNEKLPSIEFPDSTRFWLLSAARIHLRCSSRAIC
jgi:hypothetical protein